MTEEERYNRLLAAYKQVQRHFRFWYLESYKLHSYLLLYATDMDEAERKVTDAAIAQDMPDTWEEIQDWRTPS